MKKILNMMKRKSKKIEKWDLYENGDRIYGEILISRYLEILEQGGRLEENEKSNIEEMKNESYNSKSFRKLLKKYEKNN